jgi:hypothetical protein
MDPRSALRARIRRVGRGVRRRDRSSAGRFPRRHRCHSPPGSRGASGRPGPKGALWTESLVRLGGPLRVGWPSYWVGDCIALRPAGRREALSDAASDLRIMRPSEGAEDIGKTVNGPA